MYRIFWILLFLPFAPEAQTGLPAVDRLIRAGEFTPAQALIADRIAEADLPNTTRWNLQLQSAILDRIRLDFNRDETYVRRTLQPYFPDLTDEQLRKWEQSGALEMRRIDGEKRYFRNAVWNLFRIDPAAKKRKEEVDGPPESKLDAYLAEHLPGIVDQARQSGRKLVEPVHLKLRYTLTVDAGAVPAGEMIRAWLPYPRAERERLGEVELQVSSEDHYVLSPLSYPHTTIYMEKEARAEEPTIFRYEVTYRAWHEWHDLLNAKVQPFDTASALYQTYTAERPPHLRFSPALRQLAEEIIGPETDPVRKAWLLFQWMGEHIPWTSALEYSTMPDIPAYCLANRRGDCGMKSLLFITLCRYAGIPAKWQSGWFLYPVSKNLHDWTELYFEGIGWVPVDPDFNRQNTGDEAADRFFFGGTDAYRLIVNDDFSGDFFPAKVYPRSETVDFQRGEVEWRGGNLYFDRWSYRMEVAFLTAKD